MHSAVRAAFNLHPHLPSWAICGLGPLFGCRDAPHCPVATAEASAAVAWLRTGGWGPTQMGSRQSALWRSACTTADAWPRDPPARTWGQGAPLAAAASKIRRERSLTVLHPTRRTTRLTAPLRHLLWARRWLPTFRTWLRDRTLARSWLPSDGSEWRLLEGLPFTPAFHVLRLLTGCLRGQAGSRANPTRARWPWRCRLCGAGVVHYHLRTPPRSSPATRSAAAAQVPLLPGTAGRRFSALTPAPRPAGLLPSGASYGSAPRTWIPPPPPPSAPALSAALGRREPSTFSPGAQRWH